MDNKQQVNVLRRDTCGDCGVKEGQLHRLGCNMERCLSCGGQLISCNCSKDWDRLRDRDRVPFISYPGYQGHPIEAPRGFWPWATHPRANRLAAYARLAKPSPGEDQPDMPIAEGR
jgi:hypothetical protein